ncbi:NB-ARC domain-containing protein [Frankia sp. CcI49]|uniref:NB-ARC domain-containing protein n=1 Tax=Frankia sp. CcI49 TaxID=1745382 RepID=UPI0010542880|nr:NB-ARC domain-containing protein [Frankia sp. CcI49]
MQGLSDVEVGEFANAFPDLVSARQVLEDAGWSSAKLPTWNISTSEQFWHEVSDLLIRGLVTGGRRMLLAAAAARFPANPVFTDGVGTFVGPSAPSRFASDLQEPMWWLPELTGEEVARPELADQLTKLLEAPEFGSARVAALHGTGGVGKSTLASLVCHRPETRGKFPDGMLWIDVGQDVTGAALAEKINALARRLGDNQQGPSDPRQAGMRLGELLADRKILLIVDDVWFDEQVTPLLHGGPRCQRLIITRHRRLLPPNTSVLQVGTMTPAQARQMLTANLLATTKADDLAKRCGYWPVLLGLAAGYVRRSIRYNADPDDAAAEVAHGLSEAGVVAFDEISFSKEEIRSRAVAATVEASLNLLDRPGPAGSGHLLDRFLELAVFHEDAAIPKATLEILWGNTANWTAWQVHQFCDTLVDLALVQPASVSYAAIASSRREVSLKVHDVIHRYLRVRLGDRLPLLHCRLLDAHRRLLPSDHNRTSWWELSRADTYLWNNLAMHLQSAGLHGELADLAHDLRWTAARIRASGPVSVEADMALLVGDPQAAAIGHLVRQTGHLFSADDSLGLTISTIVSYSAESSQLANSIAALCRTAARPRIIPTNSVLPDQPHETALHRTLAGHTRQISALAVAPDGSWLASAGRDRVVRIWNPYTGVQTAVLSGHTGEVSALAVSPDGAWLASASANLLGGGDGTVRIWDPYTGVQTAVLSGHTGGISALAVSPDGAWIASSGGDLLGRGDGTVRIWDPYTGVQTAVLSGHTGRVSALAVSPDGAWLASAGNDRTVRIWNPKTGFESALLTGHTGGVSALSVAPDGSWLASASGDLIANGDGTVRIWDPLSGTERAVLCDQVGSLSVGALAVAPDGSWLAIAGGDGTIRFWDPSSRDMITVPTGQARSVFHLVVGPDGSWLAAADGQILGRDAAVCIIDLEAGDEMSALAGHPHGVAALAVAPDGSWLATTDGDLVGHGDGIIRVWSLAVAREARTKGNATAAASILMPIPKSSLMASASTSVLSRGASAIRLWDTKAGVELAGRTSHTGNVSAFAAAPDGSWLASAGSDKLIRLWNTAIDDEPSILTGHSGGVSVLSVAPDGSWLASAGSDLADGDGTVRIWDLATRTARTVLVSHTYLGVALAVAPDGSWLATASGLLAGNDGPVRLWDPTTGAERAVLNGHTGASVLAVAPDGTWLATAGHDGPVRLWDPASGKELATLSGHIGGVSALAVAPDGSWLASAGGDLLEGGDGTVRLWDPAAGTERAVLTGHSGRISALAAAPNGWWLASAGGGGGGGGDRTLRIWDTSIGSERAAVRVDSPLLACTWVSPERIAVGGTRGLYFFDLLPFESK